MNNPDSSIARAGRLTLYELFQSRMRMKPDAVAIDAPERTLTYRHFDHEVRRVAAGLQARGLRRGDRIALLSENRTEYVVLEMAAAMLGLIIACQNWRLAPDELRHCIRLVSPKLLIASARFEALSAQCDCADIPRLILETDYSALQAYGEANADPQIDPEDGLVILYTSGTTGLPKGALISQRAEMARMAAMRLDIRADEEDGALAWAPMFHMAATDQLLAALMSGAPVIICDGADAKRIVQKSAEYKLAWYVLMPGMMEPVMEEYRRTGLKPKGVRAVGAMADLVPLKQLAELTALIGAPFYNTFGATETGLPPCSSVLIPPGTIPSSLAKRPSSLCAIRLLDAEGCDVPDGEPGELAIRGPTVFSGYWNAPDTNARDFHDGWFRMGDLLRRNPDGSYDFVDRAKYMIKSGGENIYPAEIERVLLADPRVADAAIVRKKDAQWGEVPVAFIAARDAGLNEADIEALCRAKLAGYKRPKEVHFIKLEQFPRSTTGKIQRHAMEAWVKK
jgi:acyl-CoA synthetase (AMP-forming)/AMP-acid ligase II